MKKLQYSMVQCAPSFITKLVKNMRDPVKERIAQLGFGQLLEISLDGIPTRTMGMWLTYHVKDNPPRLQVLSNCC